MLTWCDTNTVSGPTSAKKPICPTPHRMLVSSPPIVRARGERRETHLVHVVYHAVHDLALERLEDDGAVTRHKLGLATARHDQALADVEDGDDSDDVAELARACALNIRVKFRLEEVEHPRAEVRRVQVDCMRELFLRAGRSQP